MPELPYEEFLQSKVVAALQFGIEVDESEVNPLLKPHQRDIVIWALQGGRRAIFAAFGLGKTFIQLEILRLLLKHVGGRFLIVCPLGVRQEFFRDGVKLGIPTTWIPYAAAGRDGFVAGLGDGIYLTNYETVRDGQLDLALFTGASLDEAAVLRGLGSTKTFREFMRLFDGMRFKFVATATPSPNEYIELLAYSAFLEVMDVGQAKTRFFRRNSEKADELTIHPHKEHEFFLWCATWAIFVQRPSDLGHSDEGYVLPELEIHWHEIPANHEQAGFETSGQMRIVKGAAIGVVEASREKRESLPARVEKMLEILHDRKGTKLEVLRRAPGRGEVTGADLLPREQGSPQDLHAGVSEDISAPATDRRKARGDESETPREVRERCRVSFAAERAREELGETDAGAQARQSAEGSVHAGTGAVCPDTHEPGRGLRDLRDIGAREEGIRGGSRPLDGIDSGNPLPDMQHRTGAISGFPDKTDASSGISSSQVIIWCDLNDEQRAIEQALRGEGISYSSLYGSTDLETREKLLTDWRDRRTEAFVSKPSMYGSGVNLQQCHDMIFAGIGFKFSELIQAIHRIYRFLQDKPCTIHLIYTEAEREVRRILEQKWDQHVTLMQQMSEIIRQYGLARVSIASMLQRSIGIERAEVSGRGWLLANNDSVYETRSMETDSVHLILTSIPFSTQYEYTPSYNDFGHTDSNEHFWQQMDYLTPELYRVLKPGRVALIHVKDRIVPGGITGLGFQTVYPFHVDAVRHFTGHGFSYMGMKTIVTDVVRENNQTYRLGWSEQCKDATKMGVGMPEYLLLFRKPPSSTENSYADEPVAKSKGHYSRSRWQIDAHGFARSSGNRVLAPEDLDGLTHQQIFQAFREYSVSNVYDHERHVALAEALERCPDCGHIHTGKKVCAHGECDCKKPGGRLPVTFMLLPPASWSDDVWSDVTRMLSLNSAQSAAGRENHLCPMQFDIADRAITQFSQPGEEVFDPFAGLGTVPLRAVKLGRRGRGSELNAGYWVDSIGYLKAAEEELNTPTLFDLLEATEHVA